MHSGYVISDLLLLQHKENHFKVYIIKDLVQKKNQKLVFNIIWDNIFIY